jgi:hypothetical protein
VLTVLLWVPFLLCALDASYSVVRPELVAWLVIFGVVGLVLTAYFNLRLLTARGLLLFQRADGRRMLASFRIRSRQKRATFGELLERNRAAAAGRGRDDPASPGPVPLPSSRERTRPSVAVEARPASAAPLGFLGVYLLGQGFLAPLWFALVPTPLGLLSPGLFGRGPLALVGLVGLKFLYTEGPVLLLAWLAWRWSELVRWGAASLLALHGLMAIVEASFARLPPGQSAEVPAGSVVSLLFHLVLALFLACWPAPGRHSRGTD